MRHVFAELVHGLMRENDKIVILIGDIGVNSFKGIFQEFPDRCYNIGICEQATVSLMAGLAKEGLIPIFYSIAPFIVERALEQIKIDFGYQKLNGYFVSIGASNDYSGLGCTHYCPADIPILKTIPGLDIVVPGTSEEFEILFLQSFNRDNAKYFRLTDNESFWESDVVYGEPTVLKMGKKAVVVVVGNMYNIVANVFNEEDVAILYYTTLSPFNGNKLKEFNCDKLFVFEPYYSGALDYDIHEALGGKSVSIFHFGYPHIFIDKYGKYDEQMKWMGFETQRIKQIVKKELYGKKNKR